MIGFMLFIQPLIRFLLIKKKIIKITDFIRYKNLKFFKNLKVNLSHQISVLNYPNPNRNR